MTDKGQIAVQICYLVAIVGAIEPAAALIVNGRFARPLFGAACAPTPALTGAIPPPVNIFPQLVEFCVFWGFWQAHIACIVMYIIIYILYAGNVVMQAQRWR